MILSLLLAALGSAWAFPAIGGLLVALAIFGTLLKWRAEVVRVVIALAIAWFASGAVYRAGAAACEARVAAVRAAVDAIDKELKSDYRAKLELERKDTDARIKAYVATLPDDCRATRRDVDALDGILRGR